MTEAKHQARLAAKEAQTIAFRSENKNLEEQIQLQSKADSREKQLFAAEKRLLVLLDRIGDMVLKARLQGASEIESNSRAVNADIDAKESEVAKLAQVIEAGREEQKGKSDRIIQYIQDKGSDEAKGLVGDL